MMQALNHFVAKYFAVFMMVAVPIGYFYQPLAVHAKPIMLPALMTVIFLGFLKMDTTQMRGELKKPGISIWYIVCVLIILPSIMAGLGHLGVKFLGISPAWPVTLVLLFGAPTAAFAPALANLIHANYERTLLNVVLTSFIAPATLPTMVFLLTGANVEIDYLGMARFLAMLILIPWIAALVVRRVLPTATTKIIPYQSSISVLLLMVVIFGAMHGSPPIIKAQPHLLWQAIGVLYFVYVVAFFLGWYAPGPKEPKERMTRAIIFHWMNNGMAIVLANAFFAEALPAVVLFTAISEIPWNTGFAPAAAWRKKFGI